MVNQVKAIAPHKAAPYGKLDILAGDVLQMEHRPSEWPGWVLVTTTDQLSGWMPFAFLQQTPTGWQAIVAYRDIELDITRGEELEVLSVQDDWAWCVKPNGSTGWCPCSVLKNTDS